MSTVDREAIKIAIKEMLEKKEGLSKKGVPDVAVLETRLKLKGQIGAKLSDELLAEIKPKTVPKKTTAAKTVSKPSTQKEEAPEEVEKSPAKAGPKRTSNLTLRDGVPHRVYFENGKQVKVEKVKLEG